MNWKQIELKLNRLPTRQFKEMHWIVVVLFALHIKWCDGSELSLDQIKLLNSSYMEGYFNFTELRVTKFKRFTYGINMRCELFRDIDENISMDIQIWWKRSIEQEYSLSLYHFKKLNFPDFFAKYFDIAKVFMEAAKHHSNLPPLELGKPYILKKVLLCIIQYKLHLALNLKSFCLYFYIFLRESIGSKIWYFYRRSLQCFSSTAYTNLSCLFTSMTLKFKLLKFWHDFLKLKTNIKSKHDLKKS